MICKTLTSLSIAVARVTITGVVVDENRLSGAVAVCVREKGEEEREMEGKGRERWKRRWGREKVRGRRVGEGRQRRQRRGGERRENEGGRGKKM